MSLNEIDTNVIYKNDNEYDNMGISFYEYCRNNERREIRNMQKMIEKYSNKLNETVNEYFNVKKQIDTLKNVEIEELEDKKNKKERDAIMFNYMLDHYKNLIMCELYEEK